MLLGINTFWTLSALILALAERLSLSLAQNIFIAAKINPTVLTINT